MMTHGEIALVTACVRGANTALAAFKQWARTQELSKHDEAFIHALDNVAQASKDWLRSKLKELAPNDNQQ